MVGKRKHPGLFKRETPAKKAARDPEVENSDSSDDVPLNIHIEKKTVPVTEVDTDSSNDVPLHLLLKDNYKKIEEPVNQAVPESSGNLNSDKFPVPQVETDSSGDVPLNLLFKKNNSVKIPEPSDEPLAGCSKNINVINEPFPIDVTSELSNDPNDANLNLINDLVEAVTLDDPVIGVPVNDIEINNDDVDRVVQVDNEIINDNIHGEDVAENVGVIDVVDNVLEADEIRHNRRTHGLAFFNDNDIIEQDLDRFVCKVGRMFEVCESCGAKLFVREVIRNHAGRLCCNNGLVYLEVDDQCDPFIENMLRERNSEFRLNIRKYNAALSFASIEANLDSLDPGTHVFRINGTPHHRVGPVNPPADRPRRNAQMYVVDNATATGMRVEAFPDCDEQTLRNLDQRLREINPYCDALRMIHEVETEEKLVAEAAGRPIKQVVMVLKNPGEHQPDRRFDAPAQNEVAIIFRGEMPTELPNIKIYTRGNDLHTLNILSPQTDPLCYPLLFQRGQLGYHINIDHTRGRRVVSMREFYAYKMAIRDQFNVIMFSGRLTHQYIVDSWVRTECSRLQYIRNNQDRLRADLYTGVVDHLNRVADHEISRVGRLVILPSTFANSPRSHYENYVDAITIFKNTGPPTYFITFTCNPNWKEVQEELNPFESANDRPDILNRVFHLKLNDLIDDLYNKEILGKPTSFIYSIEFQKRGLPHAHIVLAVIPEDTVHNSEDIDQRVLAELPNEHTQPILHARVISHMIHGPCGAANQRSPCMKDGVCRKKYPKPYQEHSLYNPGAYPIYRRRNNGRTALVRRARIDNRSVVPYNPFLLLKYDAHINVEICSGQKWIKYLFKYCFKGNDCLSVAFSLADGQNIVNYDECQGYLQSRYVSAPEAHWRLVAFALNKMSHSVTKLPVHLPGQNEILFDEAHPERVLENARAAETKLTAFFKLNQEDPAARQYLYKEIPFHYSFHVATKTWRARERNRKVVSRVCEASPRDRERYCLRLLLEVIPGPESFEQLKIVNDVQYDTFQSAAEARHLMINDQDSVNCLEEAAQYRMPAALRRLFVTICLNNNVVAKNLWDMFKDAMIDDFRRRQLSQVEAVNAALAHIDYLLRLNGSSCEQQGLPIPTPVDDEILNGTDAVINTEERPNLTVENLNNEQRLCYQSVMEAVQQYQNGDRQNVKTFFIDGVGGSGKSFLYETILQSIRTRQLTSIAVAVSGIAATLLTGGQTAHSAFRLPLKIDENTICNIPVQSNEAERIRQAAIILWDEASMISCDMLHAVDRLVQDVMNNKTPLGGKVFVFGGDFRQILPIVSRGSRQNQVQACIKSSYLWPQFKKFQLHTNMRAAEDSAEFSEWLKNIGEGNTAPVQYTDNNNRIHRFLNDVVEIPPECIIQEHIDDWVFNDLDNLNDISGHAILCPKNCDVDEINERVLNKMPGNKVTFFSTNVQPENNLDEPLLPGEYMQNHNASGLPPHTLNLKLNSIVMLMRNVDVRRGLCNGTRMKVDEIGAHVIKCSVISGPNRGQAVLLGRLSLQPIESGITFIRTQFPIRLSFAITINKAQGQTLDRVGVYLPTPVFSHGQLYVALSRAKRISDIKLQIKNTRQQGFNRTADKWLTKNIVFREVL